MAKIGRICKEYMVKQLTNKLKDNSSIIVTECTGLSVLDLWKLRSKLRPIKVSYVIIKNSLGKLALKNVKGDELVPHIEGTIGLALGGKDPISTSKVLLAFSKELGKLKVKGGILDGKLINEAEIKELSTLPPKDVILARAFGAMKSPISGFACALQGMISKIVYAINAVKEKKETQGGANSNE